MNENENYPSLEQQAKNLAQFSWDLIKYVRENEGSPIAVNNEIYRERTAICKTCDKFDDLERRCMECGCYIPAKARIILDSCPLNKWKDVSGEWERMFSNLLKQLDSDDGNTES